MAKEQKRAMGRGLSALLNDNIKNIKSAKDEQAKEVIGSSFELSIKDIVVNTDQPRKHFDETALHELSQSIKELGIIQPITVRKTENQKFEIIAGERRFRASQLAGLQTVPAYIRIANDVELLEMALVENIQRKDLDAIEIAMAYEKLIDEVQLTQDELSKRVGKERSTITNYLRLLKLSPLVQTGIRDGFISMGHGRALLALEQEELQEIAYEKIVKENLSVRDTENLIKSLKKPKKTTTKKEIILPNHIKKGLKKFEDYFETAVEIKANKKGSEGKIIINFESQEQFDRIQELLQI